MRDGVWFSDSGLILTVGSSGWVCRVNGGTRGLKVETGTEGGNVFREWWSQSQWHLPSTPPLL